MKKAIAIATIAIMLTAVIPPMSGANAPLAHAQSSDKIRIEGSGATFAFPLIDLWRVEYGAISNVQLNYNSIGSGGGVTSHINKLGSFGATEAPLSEREQEAAPGTITIPAMIGAISVAYNVADIPGGLKLTEEALCGIFLEEITQWDDPRITGENPSLTLPSEDIVTVHRSDGSGTTFALTSYLSKICPAWDEQIGAAKSIPWPGGIGSPGNEGVAGSIRTTDNSIGYITLAYALQNDIPTAHIQNGDHTNFVAPSLDTASAASSSVAFRLPEAGESWFGVDLLATPGFDSYPITSFSYLIIHPELNESTDNEEHAKALVDMIAWMITDGQQLSPQLGYAPIADLVSNIGLRGLSEVTYDGVRIYDEGIAVGEGDRKMMITAEDATAMDMLSDGTNVMIKATEAMAGESMKISVLFENSEHVNYDIMAVQNDVEVLMMEGAHEHQGMGSHMTDPLPTDDPVDITITFQGFGIDELTGPVGEMLTFAQIVPEFGTIAALVLAVAIVSIVVVSAKSRLSIIPRY